MTTFLKGLKQKVIPPEEVRFVFGSIADDDRQYQAIVKFIQAQSEVEDGNALRPGLANEERQYNAGRAAAVQDMLVLMEQMRAGGRDLIAKNGRE